MPADCPGCYAGVIVYDRICTLSSENCQAIRHGKKRHEEAGFCNRARHNGVGPCIYITARIYDKAVYGCYTDGFKLIIVLGIKI